MIRNTSKTNKALSKLAESFGISSEYHDIWGSAHPTSDDTRRRLLTAMGCAPDADPAQLLREVEERTWQTPRLPSRRTCCASLSSRKIARRSRA